MDGESDQYPRLRVVDASLVDSLSDYAVFAISPDGVITTWNLGAQRTFGYTPAEIIGRSFEIIFTADDIQIGAPRAELAKALDGQESYCDRWHIRKDGSRFRGTNTIYPLLDPHGAMLGFTKLVRDMTAKYLAFEQLRDSEQRFRLLVDSAREYAIFSITENGFVSSWSSDAERLFGYSPSEVLGRTYSVLFRPDDADAKVAAAELRTVEVNGSLHTERWLVRRDGSTFFSSGKISKLMTNAAGESRGFVILVHDVTMRHLAAEEVRRQARYDDLTNLPNRRTFYEHVKRAIALYKRRSSRSFAVLFIDLDNFKSVNDKLGHVIADQVLTLIARRLESCVRAGDIVARIGGDEFAILLNGIDGPLDANDTAERILTQMLYALQTDSGEVFAAVSLGIAIGKAEHERPEDIIRDADAAMYTAKSEGRGRAASCDISVPDIARVSQDDAAGMREAIARDELRLAYQPVFRLRDMVVVGLEALVRWKHPRLGLLLPSAFIPQAEESSLIFALDRWVLARACRQMKEWQAGGIASPEIQMSANVSSKEFSRNGFFEELRDTLNVNAVPPTSLRLEVTKDTPWEDSMRDSGAVAAVRALGVSVDVDDFGTGYAPLSLLNHIAVDGLKIDQSFVVANSVSSRAWDIVGTVISLSHKLGLIAVAKGVETAEHLNRFRALGCDFGQGQYLSPPLEAVAAGAFLDDKGQA